MNKRWKTGLFLYFAFFFIALIPNQASAYIDPSTTTFIVQAVVGLGVAIMAAVAVYWRKAKKKITNKLGIDENANKDVESDNIEFSKSETTSSIDQAKK